MKTTVVVGLAVAIRLFLRIVSSLWASSRRISRSRSVYPSNASRKTTLIARIRSGFFRKIGATAAGPFSQATPSTRSCSFYHRLTWWSGPWLCRLAHPGSSSYAASDVYRPRSHRRQLVRVPHQQERGRLRPGRNLRSDTQTTAGSGIALPLTIATGPVSRYNEMQQHQRRSREPDRRQDVTTDTGDLTQPGPGPDTDAPWQSSHEARADDDGGSDAGPEHVRPFRAGFVALVGRANVGKSTLLNELLDFKLSIVSPRPQTTRHTIMGIVQGDGFQAAFLDTPGMMRRSTTRLDVRMRSAVAQALAEADLIVMTVEPRMPGFVEGQIIGELRKLGKPAVLVINKADTVAKPRLLPVLAEYNRRYAFRELVPVSATRRDGLNLLLRLIAENLPEGEPLFPPDELTDRPERFLAGEIIRERVYHHYREEVPYSTTVEIETFREQDPERGGKDYIEATIYVERPNQRAILIGNGGQALKEVGAEARQRIEELLERSVHLELWVKARARWRDDEAFLRAQGY